MKNADAAKNPGDEKVKLAYQKASRDLFLSDFRDWALEDLRKPEFLRLLCFARHEGLLDEYLEVADQEYYESWARWLLSKPSNLPVLGRQQR